MKKRIFFIVAFCIYIAAVLYLCLMKPDDIPQPEFTLFGLPLDKVVHFLMFLPFPILSYSMLWKGNRRTLINLLILAASLICGVGLAFLTERLQAMTQYRSADIYDIYADMKGLATGSLLVLTNIAFVKIRNRKQHIV